MDIEKDEFEKRESLKPIPGQMCYDELLLPEIEEEKVEKDTSVAAGQMDLWNLPKQEEMPKEKPQEEADEERDFEDEATPENEEEFQIDFENPPKKLEKDEINASKSHFFGNYENPFDE